ncbi:MAG: mRNA degradation ribonuclease J1/J2 [Alphaproteobacteria bacterium]|jgi:hypothetical protein
MGGILLFAALVAIYIVVYWQINIELLNNKTIGFLGFSEDANTTLNTTKIIKKNFVKHKKTAPIIALEPLSMDKEVPKKYEKKRPKKSFLKNK